MKKILKSKKGQGMVEYILIIALIAILVIGGVKFFGSKVKKSFKDAGETISTEVNKSIDSKDDLGKDDDD
jgi:pilus assembly protein Flp/PilA